MVLQLQLNNDRLTATICGLMEENYDLGKLTRVEEILSGYYNKSYAVWMSNDDKNRRYFLRLYNAKTSEHEILFEHGLLNHLRSNGFTLSASIIPSRNGATITQIPWPENQRNKRAFWALFEFLEGEDKYSWTSTNLTDNEFVNAAEVLAHLHHCGHGFKKPLGADRVQPPIMEFIRTFKSTFSNFLKHADDRQCDHIFKDNFKTICKALDYADSFDIKFKGMTELPIHCDYHPGNLKYCHEKVVGVFDFDWSKIDYRLFDVALGLIHFTSIWGDQAEGLRQDICNLFLNSYNDACRRLNHIYPLTKKEQSYLVPMLSIANLYVLNWELVEFYSTPGLDEEEYLFYIDHTIGLMHWLMLHQNELGIWVNNS
ncbi:MAG: phosphotransferase [Desulfobacterales bacterium]|nr:phosphotransferase [Deltaproteobacteria bacterium]NNK93882.1 phosphotransferase [Desulfobacterales bacterium]